MKIITRAIVTGALLSLSSFAFAETKPAAKPAAVKESKITGTLVSEDAAKSEVVLAVKQKGKIENMSFTVPTSAKLELSGKVVALSDLQTGETIKLSYVKDGIALNVTTLKATPLPVKKEKATPKK